MLLRYSLRTALVLLLCLALTGTALGQSSNSTQPASTPSTGKALAILAASAAIFAVVLYSVIHKHKHGTGNQSSFIGCTAATDHGLVLTDEKDGSEYVILSHITLKAGERVALSGRKDEDEAGRLALDVDRLVKDYGPCQAAAGAAPSPQSQIN